MSIGRSGIGVAGISNEPLTQLQRIEAMKSELDSLRPIKSEFEQRIRQKFRLDWTYHSNSIEGNSLTYGETAKLILFDEYAPNKPGRDNREIEEHNKLLKELEATSDVKGVFTEHNIRAFHKKILGNDPYNSPALTPENQATSRIITPGRYKQEPNNVKTVTGETFEFTSPADTPPAMKELLEWANKELETPILHPLEFAAMLHYKFIRIHPFDDGNGRMARILMNVALQHYGYPPIIVRKNDKEKYLSALRDADTGNLPSFINYLGDLLIDSLNTNIRGAKGENISEEDDIDKEIELTRESLLKERDKEKRAKESIIQKKALVLEKVFVHLSQKIDKKLNIMKKDFSQGNTNIYLNSNTRSNLQHWSVQNTQSFEPSFPRIIKFLQSLIAIPGQMHYVCRMEGGSPLLFREQKSIILEVYLFFNDTEDKYKINASLNGTPVPIVKVVSIEEYLPEDEIDEIIRTIMHEFISLVKK